MMVPRSSSMTMCTPQTDVWWVANGLSVDLGGRRIIKKKKGGGRKPLVATLSDGHPAANMQM
jgi:hypothetical protein